MLISTVDGQHEEEHQRAERLPLTDAPHDGPMHAAGHLGWHSEGLVASVDDTAVTVGVGEPLGLRPGRVVADEGDVDAATPSSRPRPRRGRVVRSYRGVTGGDAELGPAGGTRPTGSSPAHRGPSRRGSRPPGRRGRGGRRRATRAIERFPVYRSLPSVAKRSSRRASFGAGGRRRGGAKRPRPCRCAMAERGVVLRVRRTVRRPGRALGRAGSWRPAAPSTTRTTGDRSRRTSSCEQLHHRVGEEEVEDDVDHGREPEREREALHASSARM